MANWLADIQMSGEMEYPADTSIDMTMGRLVSVTKPRNLNRFKKWMLIGNGPVSLMSFLLYLVWFEEAGSSAERREKCLTFLIFILGSTIS